jgi:hypothetical protein
MKPNTIHKPLDDLSPKMFEPEPDRPAPAPLESIPVDSHARQRVLLPVREAQRFDCATHQHRHWGINE